MHLPDALRSRLLLLKEKARAVLDWLNRRVLSNTYVRLTLATMRSLSDHDGTHLAAGVAYYAFLSLFPLLLGLIALLGIFLPSEQVQERIFDFFETNFPGLLDVVEANIAQIVELRGTLGIISIIGLLWAGSAMFTAVTRSVNRAMGIHKDRPIYFRKLFDLAMALSILLLFVASLGVTYVQQILDGGGSLPFTVLGQAASIVLVLIINFVIFLLIYKFLPNTKTYWRFVWPGAVLAAVLFEIAKRGFFLYVVTYANYEVVYGSVGSIIALLVWIWVSALVTILGAEFTCQYTKHKLGET